MWRTVFLYALALAAGVFVLQWLQYRYLVRAFPVEIYVALIAVAFAGLGAWAGLKLSRGARRRRGLRRTRPRSIRLD